MTDISFVSQLLNHNEIPNLFSPVETFLQVFTIVSQRSQSCIHDLVNE